MTNKTGPNNRHDPFGLLERDVWQWRLPEDHLTGQMQFSQEPQEEVPDADA